MRGAFEMNHLKLKSWEAGSLDREAIRVNKTMTGKEDAFPTQPAPA
jgi:hypothetical protein